jgi:oxygen-dependent protoporphyrinogen oxidase
VPAAAGGGRALEYASVAIVTLVLAGPTPGAGSGYLVPAVEGPDDQGRHLLQPQVGHLAAGTAVVRASVGRSARRATCSAPTPSWSRRPRRAARGRSGPLPGLLGSRVVRWGGGLPQYAVGHLDRVRRVREAVAQQPGLAVAGAAYDGVGVPAVARSGQQAARAALGQDGRHERHVVADAT